MLTSGTGDTGIGGPNTPFEPLNGPDKNFHWDNHIRKI